ncbi:DUF1800 domain-containing protein [Luteimonas sp. MJ246]|uniref:DUF1800 domain-containing protein n=1 Tax=Luteimonas TaxID=83614 RepID=UPI0031B9D4F5
MNSQLPNAQVDALRDAFTHRYKLRGQPRYAPAPAPAPTAPASAPESDPGSGPMLAPPGTGGSTRPGVMVPATRAPFAVRVLNNLGYGATPASIAEFNALGGNDAARLNAYVDRQLAWSSIDDSAVEARLSAAGYQTLGKSLQQLWQDHSQNTTDHNVRMRPAFEVQRSALARAAYSRRQLLEVMVTFWHDHFNVMVSDYSAGPVYVHYHRDVIRQHATGNFRAMLESVAQSTAMLYYLDNLSNTRSGPNENFARELLELHTFGAENYLGFMDPFQVPPCPEDPSYPIGYTDIDVYETSAAFTGWSVRNGHWQYPGEDDGAFTYRAAWHDTGPKYVLGSFIYPEQPALKDGRDILDRIASHPRVAKFICGKIIRRFFADDPPSGLVDSAAAVFRSHWQAPDQIARTLRHVLTSDLAHNAWGFKQRRPFEAVAAAMRVLGCDWTPRVGHDASDTLMWRMGFTGHLPYDWPAPNGYPDTSKDWMGGNRYAMTWKLLGWLTESSDDGVPLAPILATTRAHIPAGEWTARRLVDFWCLRILGYLPEAARRQALLDFMARNGNPETYVITDTDTWAMSDLKRHYNQQRLRSMVSLLLMSPEFLGR